MKFEKKTLEDISSRIYSGGTPSRRKQEFWNDGNILWLKTNQIGEYKIYNTGEFISTKGLNNSSAKIVPKNSITIAMYGDGVTRGKVSIVGRELTTNQACCNIQVDKNQADYRYVYYQIKSRYSELRHLSNGGAQQNLSVGLIKNIAISLPSLPTQRRIAAILSSLDDKIENNRKSCEKLEEIAQVIFKRWFVEYNFPDKDGLPYKDNGGAFEENELGLIPKGWRVGGLSDIASYANQKCSIKDANIKSYISTANMLEGKQGITTAKNLPKNGKLTKYKRGDILISNIRPYFKKIWLSDRIGTSSNDVLVIHSLTKNVCHVYYTLYQDSFFEYVMLGSKGTKMPRGDKQHIMMFPILVPNQEILDEFEQVIKCIIILKQNIKKENITLTKTRDTLLPKLMSGELAVEEMSCYEQN